MTALTEPTSSPPDRVTTVEASAVKKTFRRLMPLLILIYVLAYIDRVNIGFAALTMNPDLGLTATMFGIAGTAFFVMYAAFEVPSNMAMARFGARVWIPRIMITWGLVSMATMFAVGPNSLYGLRALLGLAEAGLFPGVLYYISTMFPEAARARANSLFLIALPLALVVGGPISGVLLQLDGYMGLKGWQWLFLLEGLASVLVGIWLFFVLPNSPKDIRWLSHEERDALQNKIDQEKKEKPAAPGTKRSSVWREIGTFSVLAFGLANFCMLSSKSVLGTWIPLIVQDVTGSANVTLVSFLSAAPPLAGIIAMLAMGVFSDRRTEGRAWHTASALALGTIGWIVCLSFSNPALKMIGLVIAAAGVYSAVVPFWALVTRHLSHRSRAVGIAAVATIGTVSPVISPILIGVLRDLTGSFAIVMAYAGVLLFLGMLLIIAVRGSRPSGSVDAGT